MIKAKELHAPILEHVYRLLWQGESAKELARSMMELPMVGEHDGLSTPLPSPTRLH